jgi:hypothetical protein
MSRTWQEIIVGFTIGAAATLAVLYFTGFPWGL